MLISLFYVLNTILFFSGILSTRFKKGERIFSIALLRCLLGIPLLACEYIYLASHFEQQAVQLVLFSEIICSLLWVFLATCLQTVSETKSRNLILYSLLELPVVLIALYFLARGTTRMSISGLSFVHYSPEYFSATFILVAMLYTCWQLEQFWRRLNKSQRWDYRILLVGCLLISGALLWSSSYRLTYLAIPLKQFQLLATLLITGWILIFYCVLRHGLLNRKVFISRKVIYSFVLPSILATYLLGFGIVSLVMTTFGLELSYVLKWFVLVLGCVCLGFFVLSDKFRRRFHFFISTNFYINKYEYRDEWLALSEELQGALTEEDIVSALCYVLSESLYTSEIFVWLGDSATGYRLVHSPVSTDINDNTFSLNGNDPLVYYTLANRHFYINEDSPPPTWENVAKQKEELFSTLYLTLVTPIVAGDHPLGFIGLGPEFTGGKYGYDDFDLLTVLGSQTASSLMAVRMAEKLANAREQEAWNSLSTFVLHDIKNAVSMLSLLQENAPGHINEPEFQKDMLELIDDALNRMGRVEQRLVSLKDELTPDFQVLELNEFLKICCTRLAVKLPLMEIVFKQQCETLPMQSDSELLISIFENLLLNTYEARKKGSVVTIETSKEEQRNQAVIKIIDNGPGISDDLLPDKLFEAFKSSKKGGSGIGLWQVKKVVHSLQGNISASNSLQGGAEFTVKLPL